MTLIKGRLEEEDEHASEGVRDKDGPKGMMVSMDREDHLWARAKPLEPTQCYLH